MSNKSKGSNTERELYQMFVDNHYRAVRVAGSGTMENADCDIIAGKKGKKFAIEAKSSKKPVKYITKNQINRFITFSEIFGLKPVIAVRFNRIGWFFINPKDMEDSGKNWVINNEIIKKKAKKFSQFFGEKIRLDKTDQNNKTLKIGDDIIINEKELDGLTGADYLKIK
jgi:Holliday junction resolvase